MRTGKDLSLGYLMVFPSPVLMATGQEWPPCPEKGMLTRMLTGGLDSSKTKV